LGAQIKSYAALDFSSSSSSFGQHVQNSFRVENWQMFNLHDTRCKCKKNNHMQCENLTLGGLKVRWPCQHAKKTNYFF